MDIQCIALDLDRTTLDADGCLSAGNRAALLWAASRGVHLVIASGRSWRTLPAEVVALPGIEYAVTSNGAAIYQLPEGECLRRFYLQEASVLDILRLTACEQVVFEAFINGQAFADEAYVLDPVRYGATPESVAYVQNTRKLIHDMPAFIREHAAELESMDIVVYDEATGLRIRAQLQEKISDIYLTSSVRQLIEIADKNAGKHTAVKYVAEILHLPREAVAAFGDADNDSEMLAWAGCGIAVSNASASCLKAADRITAAHNADGVAQGIYELLRE